MKTLDLKPQRRVLALDREAVDEKARTATLSFSSEEPYRRWWGIEILGHAKAEIVLDRLDNRAPLLLQHDPDRQIGVVERVWVDDDKRGRAVIRFGRSKLAEEIFADVTDGIRSKVSVGYTIHEMVLEKEEDGVATYRVTRWEPLEISIVAVPADDTVGVGRGEDPRASATTVSISTKGTEMSDKQKDAPVQASPPAPDLAKAVAEARAAETARIKGINTLQRELAFAGVTPDMAEKALEHGVGIAEFQKEALAVIAKRGVKPVDTRGADIGMTDKEARGFSVCRAILAAADNDWSRAGFEREATLAAAKQWGKEPRGGSRGFFVPLEVMRAPLVETEAKRDLSAGTGSAGGYTVATTLLGSSLIELLRNRMMTRRMGIQILSGLTGDVAIPKQTGGATAYWIAEGAAPTESQQTLGQVAMTPKTLGAFTDITRKLLLQSAIDVEAFVRNDIATVLALALDAGCITGQGAAGEILGILNVTGIGAVSCGTPNGGAPTWDNIIALETEVAIDNADVGALGYLTNAKVRGKLKATQKFSGTNGDPVWENGGQEPGMGMLNGYKAGVSNQVPSNLAEGGSGNVLSAIIFGNWAEYILGLWSGLDVLVDPYTLASSGAIRIINHQDVDSAVRHAESFSAAVDAITT
jgi:HK97 family phage major capsid protein